MKAQDLRNSILQLAIQGKLVPQNPNDEPADVLYAKIQAEKQKLIKTGKIKKYKPLPSISEGEIPFEIPSSWKWARLAECSDIYTGNSISENIKETKYKKVKEGYNYIGTKDVNFDCTINYDTDVKIPYNERNFRYAKEGSVLICIEGGSAGRKISILNKVVCFGNKLCSVSALGFNNKYLYYFLQSKYFRNVFNENTSGIIGGVSVNKFKELFFPLPPLGEQQRIVAKIEELEPYIKKYDEIECELTELDNKFPRQLRKSVLQYAVQGKLVPQDSNDEPAEILYKKIKTEKEKLIKEGKIKKRKNLPLIETDEVPFKIPSTWKWVRFIDLTCKIGSGSTPLGGKQAYLDRGVKFIRSQNVYNDGLKLKNIAYISEDTNKKMRLTQVHSNDLLLNITGASIGRCCIVPKDFDIGNVNQHVSIIRMILDNINKYVHIYITSPYFYAKIMNTQVGMSREGLSKGSIEKCLFLFLLLKSNVGLSLRLMNFLRVVIN